MAIRDSGTRQIRVIINALDGVSERVVKKLVLDSVANLVRSGPDGGTPVDTGWARANWIAQIGSPVTEAAGSPENVGEASSAQSAGLGSVLAYKLARGPVFISNNVPYIIRLNEGHSKQAASGFVQAAIQLAVTQLGSVA